MPVKAKRLTNRRPADLIDRTITAVTGRETPNNLSTRYSTRFPAIYPAKIELSWNHLSYAGPVT